MAAFVLDSSVTAAFLFADEQTQATATLLARVEAEGVVVPAIWALETANMLRRGERRRRLTAAGCAEGVLVLSRLPLRVEPMDLGRALGPVLDLASQHTLTSCDASYLELALRHDLPLATRGQDLMRAATAEGVLLLPA